MGDSGRARTLRAEWNGAVLAESDRTIVVDGNHYFPPESLTQEHLGASRMLSLCYWKGIARYRSVEVDGEHLPRAGWYYPQPFPWIRKIKDHVAFSPAVGVKEVA